MEDWMRYEVMLYEVFHQPCAYPFPFGSTNMGHLAEMSDEELRRLPYPRLRDQAVSVFGVFEYFRGYYMALHYAIEHQGLTPYMDEHIVTTARALRRIQVQPRRVRVLLDAAPQPRRVERN
jgi:hypothetical protein